MTIDNEHFSQLLQQMTALNSRVKELTEQNRDLRAMVNGAITTLPIIVKDELQTFLTRFSESLDKQESSKTADAIRELTRVLKDLKERLTRSELIHADMTAQVNTATDEIRLISQKLLAQGNEAKSTID